MAVSKKMAAGAATNPAAILTLAGVPNLNPASEGTEIAARADSKANGKVPTETVGRRGSACSDLIYNRHRY